MVRICALSAQRSGCGGYCSGGGSGIALELARQYAKANKVVIVGRDEATLERAPRGGPDLLVNMPASLAASH